MKTAIFCGLLMTIGASNGYAQVVEVDVDVKPTSCPNPLNVASRGVLPVAVVGSDVFDVSTIDVSTIELEGVPPLRSNIEDVATPFEGPKEDCFDDCTEDGGDGLLDLTLKFSRQDIVAALGDVEDGDCITLTLTGDLLDGTPIMGEDLVWIIEK